MQRVPELPQFSGGVASTRASKQTSTVTNKISQQKTKNGSSTALQASSKSSIGSQLKSPLAGSPANLSGEKQDLQHKLKVSKGLIEGHATEAKALESWKNAYKDESAKNTSSNAQIASLLQKLREWESLFSTLQDTQKQNQIELKNKQELIDTLQNQNSKSDGTIMSILNREKEQLLAKNKKIAELERSHSNFEQTLTQAESLVKELEAAFQARDTEVIELKKVLQENDEEMEAILNELKDRDNDINQLLDASQSLKLENELLRSQLNGTFDVDEWNAMYDKQIDAAVIAATAALQAEHDMQSKKQYEEAASLGFEIQRRDNALKALEHELANQSKASHRHQAMFNLEEKSLANEAHGAKLEVNKVNAMRNKLMLEIKSLENQTECLQIQLADNERSRKSKDVEIASLRQELHNQAERLLKAKRAESELKFTLNLKDSDVKVHKGRSDSKVKKIEEKYKKQMEKQEQKLTVEQQMASLALMNQMQNTDMLEMALDNVTSEKEDLTEQYYDALLSIEKKDQEIALLKQRVLALEGSFVECDKSYEIEALQEVQGELTDCIASMKNAKHSSSEKLTGEVLGSDTDSDKKSAGSMTQSKESNKSPKIKKTNSFLPWVSLLKSKNSKPKVPTFQSGRALAGEAEAETIMDDEGEEQDAPLSGKTAQ